jgi:hypothetical protein
MHSQTHPQTAKPHDAGMVHVQGTDGSPANGRPADDRSEILAPTKMPVPIIHPRIEESLLSAADGVGCPGAVCLCVVANGTSEAEIAQDRRSAITLRNEVVDFEWFGAKILAKAAILTQEPGTLGY